MEIWLIWVLAGVALLILEIFTPGFVAGVVGLGCLAAGLVSWLGGSLSLQVAAFAAVNLIGFIIIRPLFLKTVYRKGDLTRLGPGALVGRTGQAVQEIGPGRDGGRVKLGGEEWKAISGNGRAIAEGRTVEVTGIESTVLTVKPIEEQGHE